MRAFLVLFVVSAVGCGGKVEDRERPHPLPADSGHVDGEVTICDDPSGASEATWDLSSDAAEALCSDAQMAHDACHRCLQEQTPYGEPLMWSVFKTPKACGCPAVITVATSDGGPACSGAGTFDLADASMASALCPATRVAAGQCHVCVQAVDASGKATSWSVMDGPTSCGCPSVEKPPPPPPLHVCGHVDGESCSGDGTIIASCACDESTDPFYGSRVVCEGGKTVTYHCWEWFDADAGAGP